MRLSVLTALTLLAGCGETLTPVSIEDDGGNAYAAWESAQGRRVETFAWGGDARNQVVDFVFVVDNSVSMNEVIGKVRKGFASLKPEDFPPESRIAVMTTLPADLDDLDTLHRIVRPRTLAQDAGFTQFVSGKTIEHARKIPKLRGAYPQPGCGEDGWFRPGDVNARGVPCLVAHTQTTRFATHAEAGLTAFRQLLERNEGKMTFRPGAAVNVIFVSDTHDPGTGAKAAADLYYDRPTAEELLEVVERDNVVSSLRFHAIAPETECVERWFHHGPAYYDAAEATGGARIDMCTADNYQPVLVRVLDEGAKPTKPLFALGRDAERVESVSIDDEVFNWTLHPSKRVVEVDLPDRLRGTTPTHGMPEQQYTVEIEYAKTPGSSGGAVQHAPVRTVRPSDDIRTHSRRRR